MKPINSFLPSNPPEKHHYGTLSPGSQRLILWSVYTIALCLHGKGFVVGSAGVASVRGTGKKCKGWSSSVGQLWIQHNPCYPSLCTSWAVNTGLRNEVKLSLGRRNGKYFKFCCRFSLSFM